MSYYDEVYLKRVNRDGNTRQERIQTRKELEFDRIFVQHSQYQGVIHQLNNDNAQILVSLQPNKWNESMLISNLLTSTKAPRLKTGDIVRVFQKIKEIEYDKLWLVIFCEENIGKGYFAYKTICLDSEINFCDEYGNTDKLIPVKFVNASATFVKDYFSFVDAVEGYREPFRQTRFITSSQFDLKKDSYFEYKNKGFEISGIDDISIDGVSYISIGEHLLDKIEPKSSEKIPVGNDDNFFLINT